MLPVNTEIFWTSADGTQRRSVPRTMLMKPLGRILRYGGYGEATFPTVFDFGAGSFPIQMNDRVEVFYLGTRVYRGYVTALVPSEGSPRQLIIQANGASFWVQKIACDRQWAYPYASVDVARAFADFANTILVNAIGPQGITLFPTASVEAITVGVQFFSTLNALNRLSGDVLSDIVKAAGNLAVWGCDVDDAGNNRLYLRPFGSATPPTHTIAIPGRNVSATHGERQAGDVVNSLIIQGGPQRFQQLLHNGDFELPVPFSGGLGNIVINPSFEAGGNLVADYWVLANGASAKTTKAASPAFASPYSGSRYVELDNLGGGTETATQAETFAFVAGHTYWFQFQAAKEIASQVLSGRAILTLFDGSNSVMAGFPITITLSTQLTQSWQQFVTPFVPTAGAAKYQVEFILDTIVGTLGGLVIDEVEIFDTSTVYQDGWLLTQAPDAAVVAQNWTCPVSYDGNYSLYFDGTVTLPNTAHHSIQLQQVNTPIGYDEVYGRARFTITSNSQTVRFSFFARSPGPAGIATPNPDFPLLYMVIDWFSGGTLLGHTVTGFLAPGGTYNNWVYFEMVASPMNGSTNASAWIDVASTGSMIIDCMSVTDVAAPSMNPNSANVVVGTTTIFGNPNGPAPYLKEGNFVATIDTDNAFLLNTYLPSQGKSSTPPYMNSKALYGVLSTSISADPVTDLVGACALADAVFTSQGLPVQRPVVNYDCDPTVAPPAYWPGDTVSLQGPTGPEYLDVPAPIVEIGWLIDRLLSYELQVQREKADDSIALVKLMLNLIRINGTGNTGSGFTNMGTGGPGGAGTNGIIATDGTNAFNATTLQFAAGTMSSPSAGVAEYALPAAAIGTAGVVALEANSADTNPAHAVTADDTRLSDARTPTAHAASHGNGGSDQVTIAPAQISGGTSATITTAKLTGGGTNGSMTFVNGVLTASTPAT